eukprot:6528617-Prymnesium_polylepis.4
MVSAFSFFSLSKVKVSTPRCAHRDVDMSGALGFVASDRANWDMGRPSRSVAVRIIMNGVANDPHSHRGGEHRG